ncbi:MAG: YlmC/YmxH family sporulation protein [Oscillospiraceae bacterium]|nr:YlmC/YmxH family sporulation protein [Oscillospiraceae bacterium]
MRFRMTELLQLEMIDVLTGQRLGFADDAAIDSQTGQLLSLICYGQLRCFGLLGRRKDVEIPFDCVRLIGAQTILVEQKPTVPKTIPLTDPDDPLAAYYAEIHRHSSQSRLR